MTTSNTEAMSFQEVGSSPAEKPRYSYDDTTLVRQTRTRRLFSTEQLFALNLAMYGTWYGVGGNVYFALQNGGPQGWLFGYVIVSLGVGCQVASFAEMASVRPVAGAQYYWTYHYAPPRTRRFLTWMQGWTTWLGYVSMLASYFNAGIITLQGAINVAHTDWTPTGWQTTLMIMTYLVLIAAVNLWAFWAVPWFELLAGVVNVVLFLVVLVVLWVVAPRNSLDIFLTKSSVSGWGDFVSFNVGSLATIYLFIAFEGTVHLGEETRNPKRAVPAGMFWGYVANLVMGFIMVITFGIAMPDLDEILSSISPISTILNHATSSPTATVAMVSAMMLGNFAGAIGNLSSVSRLTWAWSRDGGLPRYFAVVDGRTRVPMRAVLGTAAIIAVLALLTLNDRAFIAFGAITALSALALYVSYAIALCCVMFARLGGGGGGGGLELGEWNCGGFGLFFNAAGLLYTVYQIVWLPFPNLLPVTATNMNYSGPLYVLVIACALGYWFLWARGHWEGPNTKVVEIVLQRNEDAR
ncbi:uncharacterized protein PpBr36_06198 [Pyricularia pennisetigena]|uniref:uncharacterized protein n=1 Tax=Pyricularia pennisetigena TaxID=1578925 RepID=UPI0011506293|nr:uncharacterized protein PpBr36_06198 [Pyricularia pennisetigena]TLS23358.1 hypothetical protein PpBr36_06198 [Pyricularia pennisetigena]